MPPSARAKAVKAGEVQARMAELAEKIEQAKRELEIAGEQLAFQTGVAEEAQVHGVVEGTTLANRERKEAEADLERMRRYYERCRETLSDLNLERDRILDQMLDAGP